MTRRAALVLAGFFASAVCALAEGREDPNSWRQHCGSADHNNERALRDAIACPEVLWLREGALGVPAVADGKVYAAGKRLALLALDTGATLAEVPAASEEELEADPPKDQFLGTPVVLDDMVIAVKTSGMVQAFSRDLSKKIWELDVSGLGSSWGYRPPAFDDGVLVLAGGIVLGIDPSKGEIIWKADGLRGSVEMAPAVWGKRVFFGTREGALYALDLRTGKEVWKTDHECQFGWSDPAVADGRIFLSDRGGNGRKGAFHAFDAGSGKEVWMTEFGMTGSSTPGFGKGKVFWGFGKFVAFYDRGDGKVDETTYFRTGFNPFGSPTLVGDTMYFGNLDGNLYAFDMKSKRLKWRFAPGAEDEGEEVKVLGFAYLPKGVILSSTTKGLFAIGQSKSKRSAPDGYVLSYKPEPKSVKGKVVDIKALEKGWTLYVVETDDGAKVELMTDQENMAKWLVQSWEGKCKVSVQYSETKVDGKKVNKIDSVSPSR